jgi:hypothetical protein
MALDYAGLFATPDQYQLAQQQAQQAEAAKYAQLDPRAQAQYGFYRGGQQLTNAIGGALGIEDPQLKIISNRQTLASQLDPTNLDSYKAVAQAAMDAGDQPFAMAIADAGRQAAIQISQANKERQLAVPADIQKAQFIGQLQDNLAQLNALPPSAERDRAINILSSQLKALTPADKTGGAIAVPLQVAARLSEIAKLQSTLSPDSQEYKLLDIEKTQLQKPEKPEKPEARPSVGSDREGIALELFGKNFYDLDQTQRATVNAKADAQSEKKAAQTAPKIQVDLKDPTAVAKAGLDVMGKWEAFLKSGGDVEVANRFKSVQSAVAMANAGNPTADGAILYGIAKMYDPTGSVLEGDKKSVTGNPNIPTRFKLFVQGVLEGGSFTPQQRKDLLNIANEIVKNRESQLNVYRKQYINKNKALGGVDEDILNPYQGLNRPPLSELQITRNPRGRQ